MFRIIWQMSEADRKAESAAPAPAAGGGGGAAVLASTNGSGNTSDADPLAPIIELVNELSARLAKLESTPSTSKLVGQVIAEFDGIAALLSESATDPSLSGDERKRYSDMLEVIKSILRTHRGAAAMQPRPIAVDFNPNSPPPQPAAQASHSPRAGANGVSHSPKMNGHTNGSVSVDMVSLAQVQASVVLCCVVLFCSVLTRCLRLCLAETRCWSWRCWWC